MQHASKCCKSADSSRQGCHDSAKGHNESAHNSVSKLLTFFLAQLFHFVVNHNVFKPGCSLWRELRLSVTCQCHQDCVKM